MEKDKSANLERQKKKKWVVQKSKLMWMNPFPTAPHLERELAIKEQLASSMTQLLACSGKSILLVAGLPMQIHATLTNCWIHKSWRREKKIKSTGDKKEGVRELGAAGKVNWLLEGQYFDVLATCQIAQTAALHLYADLRPHEQSYQQILKDYNPVGNSKKPNRHLYCCHLPIKTRYSRQTYPRRYHCTRT